MAHALGRLVPPRSETPYGRLAIQAQLCLLPKAIENSLVRARIEPRRKRNAEVILSKLGISPGQAINMLYAQIELKKGLPFRVVTQDMAIFLGRAGPFAFS